MSDVTRVEKIYLSAIELSEPIARAAYLASACGEDNVLRRQVDELLAAHEKIGQFLNPPGERTRSYTPDAQDDSATVGVVIAGRFKLLQCIGEGGMGSVWVAEQTEPVKRKVAVKLIKAGMDNRAVLARFEAERQALAVMDHPNIAKVLDGGLHDGRPYFVMELVKGVPITEFCDARRLTPRERLDLFVPVCQAIQHAHQKGVIHRDIKPSNVLVALYDDRPIPKVIDFGVAKATGQTLTDKTLHTDFGAVVGTPEYMSPEQASFNNLDIDTRSDVYSLGVLLYELLTGTTPVDRKSLKEAAVLEVLRIVREVDAPRPSQKLSTTAMLASIAANRGTEPAKLPALVRGELDWIVLKALEKDRGRRYESANGLAADINRYLAGDSVEACPPTWTYRLRKAYKRNRPAVLAGGVLALVLVKGALIAGWLAMRAVKAEEIARQRQYEALEQASIAEKQRDSIAHLSDEYLNAAVDAEIRSASARLDSNLLEYKAESRSGLLRLARPLKTTTNKSPINETRDGNQTELKQYFGNNPEFIKLRQFQTAAVIVAGQEFVPLLPPLVSDKDEISISPDYRLCISGFEREGLGLYSIPSMKRLGTIREGAERLVKLGFSPDSKTIYTQDTDSVVRFWNTDGTLRAKTPMRPERFVYPGGLPLWIVRHAAKVANPILIADGVVLIRSEQRVEVQSGLGMEAWQGKPGTPGPTDLYSARTGKFIRRLAEAKDSEIVWTLSPNNRWLVGKRDVADPKTHIRNGSVIILSADDGRELARLNHSGPEPYFKFSISPSEKWIMTYRHSALGKSKARRGQALLWRSADWKPFHDESFDETLAGFDGLDSASFLSDETINLSDDGIGDSLSVVFRIGQRNSMIKETALGYDSYDRATGAKGAGRSFIRFGRALTDPETYTRYQPKVGRKYAEELALLAPDGRFWNSLDTVTEKDLPVVFFEGGYLPGFGQATIRSHDGQNERNNKSFVGAELQVLPDTKFLDIPPDILELWAQVVVGGELGPDGLLVKWDHKTWIEKQRKLASFKPPHPEFPFPGWVAQEPNLWLFIRARDRVSGPEHEKLIKEFQRLSGLRIPPEERDNWKTPEPVSQPKKEK